MFKANKNKFNEANTNKNIFELELFNISGSVELKANSEPKILDKLINLSKNCGKIFVNIELTIKFKDLSNKSENDIIAAIIFIKTPERIIIYSLIIFILFKSLSSL
ncbi:hypothetical protein QTH99_13040 [Clostridium perfringens]|nr:hypothetical protein [Clostridium perfringens]MDK0594887.1 hypothetical protein [Clostridium perfringens]MDM0624173.1 hypothetical protein [Clostridium perfringens]MDM0848095.1 hypothetical protein [Clostridium perfringens]MDM0859443.1 hypothetical protein [Clostridium perfringens]